MGRSADCFIHRLMAVLTVVAAFTFQGRAGGGLSGWWTSASADTASVSVLAPTAGVTPATEHGSHPASHHHGSPPTPQAAASQTPAAPRRTPAPESGHQHSAHCPFCVTNAFALEGLPDDAPRAPLARAEGPARLHPVPVTLPAGRPRARAPPVLG